MKTTRLPLPCGSRSRARRPPGRPGARSFARSLGGSPDIVCPQTGPRSPIPPPTSPAAAIEVVAEETADGVVLVGAAGHAVVQPVQRLLDAGDRRRRGRVAGREIRGQHLGDAAGHVGTDDLRLDVERRCRRSHPAWRPAPRAAGRRLAARRDRPSTSPRPGCRRSGSRRPRRWRRWSRPPGARRRCRHC